MTLSQLLQFLRKHQDGWYLTGGARCIRTIIAEGDSSWSACPITRVCGILKNKWFDVKEWDRAAHELEIPFRLAEAIMMAADIEDGHDPKIRRLLLKAAGLGQTVTQ